MKGDSFLPVDRIESRMESEKISNDETKKQINRSTEHDGNLSKNGGKGKVESEKRIPQNDSRNTPKRSTSRQRKSVVLLQDQYLQIYATANNRASRTRSKSPTPNSVTNGISKSSSKGSLAKGNNNLSKDFERDRCKNTSSSSISRLSPKYIWVDSGKKLADGTTQHNQVEIKVGNQASLINVGDAILLSSGEYDDDVMYLKHDDVKKNTSSLFHNNTPKNSMVNETQGEIELPLPKPKDENEVYSNDADNRYIESALQASMNDIAINQLDPFIARVEAMWEEPPKRTKSKKRNIEEEYTEERLGRMKLSARWFYKRDDIAGLSGNFEGISQEDLLYLMTPRDLLLGNQVDENEITTILGKCQILYRKPSTVSEELEAKNKKNNKRSSIPGAFVCSYDINLIKKSHDYPVGSILITPYDGPMKVNEPLIKDSNSTISEVLNNKKRIREDNVENESIGSAKTKKQKVLVDSESFKSKNENVEVFPSMSNFNVEKNHGSKVCSSDDEIASSDNPSLSDDQKTFLGSQAKLPISEGSTLQGVINIGPGHQVSIPPLLNKKDYVSNRSQRAQPVWIPGKLSDEEVEMYIKDAMQYLERYMMKNYHYNGNKSDNNFNPSLKGTGERKKLENQPYQSVRECNLDFILCTLHDNTYDRTSALCAISKFPDCYLTVWNPEEQEYFNIGFMRHFSELHLILKGIRSSRNHKDVVDYYYRFKIPDLFQRYKQKKREQARRMMGYAEIRKIQEVTSLDGMNNSTSSKKSRNWSVTGGGGPNGIGAAESRRLMAKDFLSFVRDTLGMEKYLTIVHFLKGYQSRVLSIVEVKNGVNDILQNHPELRERFCEFLPRKVRS